MRTNPGTPEGREPGARTVRNVAWLSLGVNVLLSGFKLAAGLIGRSQAVVADSVHSLSDAVTDVAILVGVRYWSAPADETHPHGHGRIETLVTLLISALLAAAAVLLAHNAIVTLEERHAQAPRLVALVAALISIAGKEALYRWSVAVGRRARSPALIANAWHHRSDALSSVPAALAVLVARIHPSWAFVDHVGAIVVSLIILQAAWRIGWPALQELADAGAGRETRRRIEDLARSTPGVEKVHAVRTRRMGSGIAVDLHVLVDGGISVRRGHDISERVKARLLAEGPDLVDVVVHVEPLGEDADGV